MKVMLTWLLDQRPDFSPKFNHVEQYILSTDENVFPRKLGWGSIEKPPLSSTGVRGLGQS